MVSMAKKKTETAAKPESKAPAAKKAAPAKKPAAAPAGDHRTINTDHAAAAAAAMVGNRVGLGGGGPKPESAAFKAMKQNLHKPNAGGVGDLLGGVGGQKKSNQPFAGGKQVGK